MLHKENLDQTLAHFDIEKSFSEDARQRLNRAWEHLPAWPDVANGMQLLRSFGFVAPCSNGSIALSIRLARFAGFSWDTVLGAEVARNYKPKSEVYRAAVNALALKPEEVVMVAAHNDDLEAASKEGLQTAFFPRVREYGPDQAKDHKAEKNWTYVATDLLDLASQICSERRA